MRRIEPAVTTLWYNVAHGTSYIDIAKDLSMINRRLYRQGMVYAIQDIQVGMPNGMRSTDVWQGTFAAIPNTWIAHNAWTKAQRTWRDQQQTVLDALPGTQGKWADFKIYLDDSMEDGTILTPVASDGAVFTAGDWDHSRFVFDDDGTERHFKMHMVGSSNLTDTNAESAIGLIYEYAHSRPNVNISEPDVEAEASDTIYAKLLGTDEMSDILVGQMETDNDVPPYDQDEFPGGDTNGDCAQLLQIMSCNAQQSVGRAPGFIAPCGLIKVDTNEIALNDIDPAAIGGATYASGTAATVVIGITVASGPYRGVLATPMGQ